MEEKCVTEILKRVAKENGVPLAVVLSEIERIIDTGMQSADWRVRRRWDSIPCRGLRPTVTELISYLVDEVQSAYSGQGE